MRTRDLDTIDTYAAANRVLDGRDSRVVANNTRLVRDDFTGNIKVRLHETDIITYLDDGRIMLNDGGWPTVTTAQRMHAMTPANVRVNRSSGRHLTTPLLIATVGDDKIMLGGMPVVIQP